MADEENKTSEVPINYSEMLQDLLDLEEGLSEWQVEFIENLATKRNQYGTVRFSLMLTDKQLKALRALHADKITGA